MGIISPYFQNKRLGSCVQQSKILLTTLEPQYSYNICRQNHQLNSPNHNRIFKTNTYTLLTNNRWHTLASLRRVAASLRLATRYQDENHYLHHLLHEASSRLTSRWPLVDHWLCSTQQSNQMRASHHGWTYMDRTVVI